MDDWAPGTKNENGVYCPHEALSLKRESKGWRGCNRADVALVQTPEGWRGKTGFQLFSGSWWGHSGPLTDYCPPYPTREGAIQHCAAQFHKDFAKLDDPAMQREAREIIAWAEALCPAQMDLFGAAA